MGATLRGVRVVRVVLYPREKSHARAGVFPKGRDVTRTIRTTRNGMDEAAMDIRSGRYESRARTHSHGDFSTGFNHVVLGAPERAHSGRSSSRADFRGPRRRHPAFPEGFQP